MNQFNFSPYHTLYDHPQQLTCSLCNYNLRFVSRNWPFRVHVRVGESNLTVATKIVFATHIRFSSTVDGMQIALQQNIGKYLTSGNCDRFPNPNHSTIIACQTKVYQLTVVQRQYSGAGSLIQIG